MFSGAILTYGFSATYRSSTLLDSGLADLRDFPAACAFSQLLSFSAGSSAVSASNLASRRPGSALASF